jgi:PAS domain-containing protein
MSVITEGNRYRYSERKQAGFSVYDVPPAANASDRDHSAIDEADFRIGQVQSWQCVQGGAYGELSCDHHGNRLPSGSAVVQHEAIRNYRSVPNSEPLFSHSEVPILSSVMVRPTSAFWTIRYDPDMAQPPESNPARSANLSPERLLAAIVDSSDDAVVSKDLNGVVTSWNKGAQRIFGYTAEEMVGQSIVRLMPPDRVNEETGNPGPIAPRGTCRALRDGSCS